MISFMNSALDEIQRFIHAGPRDGVATRTSIHRLSVYRATRALAGWAASLLPLPKALVPMKLIVARLPNDAFSPVRTALIDLGVLRVTVSEVHGHA